jgi:hypothetical protein
MSSKQMILLLNCLKLISKEEPNSRENGSCEDSLTQVKGFNEMMIREEEREFVIRCKLKSDRHEIRRRKRRKKKQSFRDDNRQDKRLN